MTQQERVGVCGGRESGGSTMEQRNIWRGSRLQCRQAPQPRLQDAVFTKTASIDHFLMFTYKIATCPRNYSHDWIECPYAHSGESARRREPHTYKPIPCPESKGGQPCPRGDSCKYAHNDIEYWLHPIRYKTEYCKKGSICTRKVCFFAHKPEHLRVTPPIVPPVQNTIQMPAFVESAPYGTTSGTVQAGAEGGQWDAPRESINIYPGPVEQWNQLQIRGGVPGNLKDKDLDGFRFTISSGLPAMCKLANPNGTASCRNIPSANVPIGPSSFEIRHSLHTRMRGLPEACRHPITTQPHRAAHQSTILSHCRIGRALDAGGNETVYFSKARPHSAPLGREMLVRNGQHEKQDYSTLLAGRSAKYGYANGGLYFLGGLGGGGQ